MLWVWLSPFALGAAPPQTELQALTEKLYLNYRHIDGLYHEMRQITQLYMQQPADQHNYVQKIALFINEARLICYYQWSLLAIHDYIKEALQPDYYTLRLKDLRQAKSDLTFNIQLLDLYSRYVEQEEARKPVTEAIANIRAAVYLMEGMIRVLEPLATAPH